MQHTESLWTDEVIGAFILLIMVIGLALNEIAKAQEAFDKMGEYQDQELDEFEKEISK